MHIRPSILPDSQMELICTLLSLIPKTSYGTNIGGCGVVHRLYLDVEVYKTNKGLVVLAVFRQVHL